MLGLRCRNERCITNNEGVRYLVRDFRVRPGTTPMVLACAYCEREVEARFVGDTSTRSVYGHNARQIREIRKERRAYFATEAQARAAGFTFPND